MRINQEGRVLYTLQRNIGAFSFFNSGKENLFPERPEFAIKNSAGQS